MRSMARRSRRGLPFPIAPYSSDRSQYPGMRHRPIRYERHVAPGEKEVCGHAQRAVVQDPVHYEMLTGKKSYDGADLEALMGNEFDPDPGARRQAATHTHSLYGGFDASPRSAQAIQQLRYARRLGAQKSRYRLGKFGAG